MNKTRRKAIATLTEKVDGALSDAQEILGEEQEEFDGLSERAQEGEKGEERQAAISALEEVVSSLESALNSLQEASGG